jgi:hypothetical protein
MVVCRKVPLLQEAFCAKVERGSAGATKLVTLSYLLRYIAPYRTCYRQASVSAVA